jgi:hypothetical protein
MYTQKIILLRAQPGDRPTHPGTPCQLLAVLQPIMWCPPPEATSESLPGSGLSGLCRPWQKGDGRSWPAAAVVLQLITGRQRPVINWPRMMAGSPVTHLAVLWRVHERGLPTAGTVLVRAHVARCQSKVRSNVRVESVYARKCSRSCSSMSV